MLAAFSGLDFRVSGHDKFGEEVVASGHECSPLSVFHEVGVVPHGDFGAGEVGGIDGDGEVPFVGKDSPRGGHVSDGFEVVVDLNIDDRDTSEEESVDTVDFSGANAVQGAVQEGFFVVFGHVTGHEEYEVSVVFHVSELSRGSVVECLKEFFGIPCGGHVGHFDFVDVVFFDSGIFDDSFEESVEGVEGAFAGGISDPHGGTDGFCDGFPEEGCFGLFEFGSGEVSEVHVRVPDDSFVDHREVVICSVSHFGFDFVEFSTLIIRNMKQKTPHKVEFFNNGGTAR